MSFLLQIYYYNFVRKDVGHPHLVIFVTCIIVVITTDIHADDRRSIPNMVFSSLQAFLQHTLPQGTWLSTVHHLTWQTGGQSDKRMQLLG
jgi:hypothetical protein